MVRWDYPHNSLDLPSWPCCRALHLLAAITHFQGGPQQTWNNCTKRWCSVDLLKVIDTSAVLVQAWGTVSWARYMACLGRALPSVGAKGISTEAGIDVVLEDKGSVCGAFRVAVSKAFGASHLSVIVVVPRADNLSVTVLLEASSDVAVRRRCWRTWRH